MNRLDGRIGPDRIAGPGALVGYTLVWDGARFRAAPSAAAVFVSPTPPPSPTVGQLWYDTDA